MSKNKIIEIFEQGRLKIVVTVDIHAGTMEWFGESDFQSPDAVLGVFLQKIIGLFRGKCIQIDFSKFEFMNSATLMTILQFVKKLDINKTKTTLCYDTAIEWQLVAFRCMKAISRTLQNIDVVEAF